MPFLLIDPYTRRSHLFTYHNKTQYFRYEHMYDDVKKQDYVPFELLVLDSLGHKIDSSYTRIGLKYPAYNVDLRKYKEGKYVCLIDCRENNNVGAPKDVKLVYFDENFKVEKIVDISSILSKVINSRIAYIDANNILLESTTDVGKNGLLYFKVSGTLLKSSGEFIESTDFNNYELSDNNYDTVAMTYLPKTKQTVLINIRKQVAKKTFDMEIITTKGKGTFELLKTLTIDGGGAMGIYDVTSIGDSSLLCRYKYVDFVSKNEYKTDVKWSIWAMFPMTTLGIVTSDNEVSFQSNIKYFPNPTDNILNIQFEQEHIGKLLLYNMQGQEIKSQNFLNYGNQWQISTLDLSEGFYMAQIQLGNGEIYTKKVLVQH
jgi:Secretion system C-terminal sorting domain